MLISFPFSEKPPKPVKVAYVSAAKAAKKLGITSRRLRVLASQGRVAGAVFVEKEGWRFPKNEITIRPGKRGPALSFEKPAA